MASGQPSGVPLPSRKTASGPSERPPLRTRRKERGPRRRWPVGARSTYLCALARFMSGLKWNSGRGEYFSQITIKQRRESSAAPPLSFHWRCAEFCGSAEAKLQKGKPVCLPLRVCVFLLRRSRGAHSEFCLRWDVVKMRPGSIVDLLGGYCCPTLAGRGHAHL